MDAFTHLRYTDSLSQIVGKLDLLKFREDGYFNMTAEAKAFDKRTDHIFSNEETNTYIETLKKLTGKSGSLDMYFKYPENRGISSSTNRNLSGNSLTPPKRGELTSSLKVLNTSDVSDLKITETTHDRYHGGIWAHSKKIPR